LVAALVNDFNTAEDVVHDFFVSFAQSGEKLKLQGSLKSYLAVCVVNKARDKIRNNSRRPENLEQAELLCTNEISPEFSAICNEEFQILYKALMQIPYEQKEAIMLHIKGGIKFDDIAKMQNVSIKTVQSRYRYGLDKLKIILNGQVQI
jgi:RNA polymerase sigma-70 factor (ECF subfamily)